MNWQAQSPYNHPSEHLGMDGKKSVKVVKLKNLQELWITAKNTWENIPHSRCSALVDSMLARCAELIKEQ